MMQRYYLMADVLEREAPGSPFARQVRLTCSPL